MAHSRTVAGWCLLLCGGLLVGCEPDAFVGAEVTFGFGESSQRLSIWTTSESFYNQAKDRLGVRLPTDFPVLELIDGSGCDRQWSWHVNPQTPVFAEATIEMCQGSPLDVEAAKDYWLHTVGYLCASSAWVVDVRVPVERPEECQ